MSDIGVVGIAGLFSAAATAFLGFVGLLFAAIVASSRTGDERRGRLLAGPAVCMAIGCVALAVSESVSGSQSDELALLWPSAGIGAWVAVAVMLRSRTTRRKRSARPQRSKRATR